MIDKYRGTLIGLALGDTLGATLKFQEPGAFDPIDDIVVGGPWCSKPGEWTRDTSMALCLAESLFTRMGFEPDNEWTTALRKASEAVRHDDAGKQGSRCGEYEVERDLAGGLQ